MTKKEARQQVKEWMKKLDKNYIEKADQSIFEQVKELKEFQEAKTIFCYETGEECRSSIVYWERNHGSETNSCFR